jgi:hypothetical protein
MSANAQEKHLTLHNQLLLCTHPLIPCFTSMYSSSRRIKLKRPYGPAHQIGMNLAVLVKYNALEQTMPVLETFRLGSLPVIAEELRLPASTRSYDDIKSALLHIVEQTKDKEHAYRQVIFSGEPLPDGSEADAVYTVFSKAYVEFLEYARVEGSRT